MDLESVIQSEISQKEKNKYCILIQIGVIKKKGQMIRCTKLKQRHRRREQMYGYQGGKGAGGTGYWD